VSFVPPFDFIRLGPLPKPHDLWPIAQARDPICGNHIMLQPGRDGIVGRAEWSIRLARWTAKLWSARGDSCQAQQVWPTNLRLRSFHSWRRDHEVPTAAVTYDTGGELRTTRLANRPREFAQALPAARARQGAVARGAGVARAGAG